MSAFAKNNVALLAEQEKSSDECFDLTPSSKGRQRKRNVKYLDYDTEDAFCAQNVQEKSRRSSAGGRGRGRGRAHDKKSPPESEKPGNATQKTADGEVEVCVQTPQNSDGTISEETPKQAGRPKKTPTKKTPAKKTPAKKMPVRTPSMDGGLPTAEGGDVGTVQQKNGTPKRKYVRKHPAKEVEPATDSCKEARVEPQAEAEEEEEAPGGRRRRSAAKM